MTGSWHVGEFVPPLVVTLVYLVAYRRRWQTLARRGHRPAGWRAAAFVGGTALVAVVQLPPLDGLADSVLLAHMAQHILIGDVASFLIVVGLTGPMLAPLLAFPVTRVTRRLANPVVALVLWGLDLYAWHVPLLYQLAIRHDLVHALEHACLLWFGVLLWLALIGPLPKPRWFGGWARLGYVFGVRLLGALLANLLIWAQTVFYPIYRASDARRGLNPLSDQNLAGGLMMVEQIVLTTLLLGWIFYRFAQQDEARQGLLDLAADHGVTLSDERAGRAAEAGPGASARLRERIGARHET